MLSLQLVLLAIQSLATLTSFELNGKHKNDMAIEQSVDDLEEEATKETEQLETIKEEIKSRIDASNNINEEEKSLIWNENLIENVVPYYETSGFVDDAYTRHTNIDITGLEGEKRAKDNITGYYTYDTNVMQVRDYELDMQIDEENVATLYHEYIHLLQVNYDYRVLTEGSANIICEEFFDQPKVSYPLEVRYTKILMEIIGPEPIWRYNFEENSQALEEAIKPYLEDGEYKTLMQILNANMEVFPNHLENLNNLLKKLYYNKYGRAIYEDDHLKALLTYRETLPTIEDELYYNRSYFNEEKINQVYNKETLGIPLNIIDENRPLYKLRPIDSIDELRKEECVYIDEAGNYYAKKFVTSDEYFSSIEDQDYQYVTIEKYLTEQNGIPKCGELEEYHLENGHLVYTVVEKSSNIFAKFPEQSISKREEALSLTRTKK